MATKFLSDARDLPIHFFTIVLNGEPFIRHHLAAFQKLSCRWHWHVIEGVAALVKDTGWSVAGGGHIPDGLHDRGRSVDGTTDYLDDLQRRFPDRVTVHRKLTGQFWDGKLEMIQAFLPTVREEALVWQVDADELWRPDQIERMRAMFLACPDRSAAYFLCHYFVGEGLVTTSLDTYGNNRSYEWLRVWRYQPGDVWHSHEPPRLGRPTANGSMIHVGALNPFLHEETAAAGLVFDHYAYVLEEQARFKEAYYGYQEAVSHWRRLQENTSFPARLGDFLPWVTDNTVVDRANAAGVVPLAKRTREGWSLRTDPPAGPAVSPLARRQLTGRLPFRRKRVPARAEHRLLGWLDRSQVSHLAVLALGGPLDLVLASGFLRELQSLFPRARVTVLAGPGMAELLEFCPYVSQVAALPPDASGDMLLAEAARRFGGAFDLVLNPLPGTLEPLAGRLAAVLGAGVRVGWQFAAAEDSGYTHLLEPVAGEHPVTRHARFLSAFENRPIPTHPEVWPGPRADNAARDLLAGALAAGADRFVVLDLTGSAGDAERWADLGRRLQDLLGLTPVLVGSAAADAAVAQAVAEALGGTAVNTVGKASTDALLGILRRADLHIGSADALEHLAAASGVPVVMIGDGAAVPPWGVAAAIVTPEGQGGFRPTVVMEAARHVLHAARRL